MSLVRSPINNVNEDFLSSNDKVIRYLQNSTFSSTANNSLSMLKRSPSANFNPLQQRLRYGSENGSTSSSSSSSAVDSSTQSESSFESSLSDPVAQSGVFISNTSSEDIDFNIGFDQISDSGEDTDDDYDNFYYDLGKLASDKKQYGIVTVFDKPNGEIRFKSLEDFLVRSSNINIKNCNNESNGFNNINSINTKEEQTQQQLQDEFLHDSTFTLCSEDPFSPYMEEHDNDQDNEQKAALNIRSNSLSILHVNGKSAYGKTAPKKAVRFADTLGLDLESIRYMSPPDQSTPLLQECFRVQLGQLRVAKLQINIPSMQKSSASSSSLCSPTKKYNLVSKQFMSPTKIIPLIYEKQVMLECLYTKDSTAYGTIRVHNCTYEKLVYVRLTHNEWLTYNDIKASHSMTYAVDNTDTFTFQICLSQFIDVSTEPKRILFAICFRAMSQEFWDNNQGCNYVLDVFERR